MTALLESLRSRIRADGPLGMATYMSLCLTHPEHGYYSTRTPLGKSGDFTTAPEISQLFGEMIGFWVADVWQQIGAPEYWHLVECGPGRGTLMADVLRILSSLTGCTPTVHLIEVGEGLRQQQKMLLDRYHPYWHENLSSIPEKGPVIIFSNEFFDALPVSQFIQTEKGLDEVVVGLNQNNDLIIGRVPSSQQVTRDLPLGAVIEVSPAQISALDQMASRVSAQGGACLMIDYGYESLPLTSTLQAVQGHQQVPVLHEPGRTDLTTLVDFSTLAQRAGRSCRVCGPVSQREFLLSLGIMNRAEKLSAHSTEGQRQDMQVAIQRLTAPDQMGDLFRVLAFHAKQNDINPAGF